MYTVYLNGQEVLTSINDIKRKIKHFLSARLLANTRTVGLYTAQYEDVTDIPAKKENRRVVKIKAPVNDIIEPGKNEAQAEKFKRPKINYFAGPHCVFDPRVK